MSILSLSKRIFGKSKSKRKEKGKEKAAFRSVGKSSEIQKDKEAPKKQTKTPGDFLMQNLVSEKAMQKQAENVVVFRVAPSSTKGQIARVVEETFGCDVLSVRVASFKPKTRRRGTSVGSTNFWKKAYVTVSDISKVTSTP